MGRGALRLLLDRPLPARIAERLRAAGHDVVAAAERADLRCLDDAKMLQQAGWEGRALVGANAPDLLSLAEGAAAEGRPHRGIVLMPHRGFPRSPLSADRLARALSHLLDTLPDDDALAGQVHWLEPPRVCPFHSPSSLESRGG